MAMKRILSIAAIILLFSTLICGCGEEEGYPAATNYFYVNDFANVIDDKILSIFLMKCAKTG